MNKAYLLKQQIHTNRALQPEIFIKSSRLYLSQYFVHIVDSLPKVVRPVVSRASELPALREAALAFSAARFAYSMGDSYEAPSKKLLLLRPHRQLFIQSLDYFSRAIQLIQPGTSQVEDMLAAVIFIIFFENVLGTVTSYHCHLRGLETLAIRHHHALSGTPYGQLLLRASLFIRAKGFLFLGPLRALPSNDVADRELGLLAHQICVPQEHLFLIVADAIRISSSLLLGKCAQSHCDSLELVFRKVSISGYSEGHLLEGLHTESESYQKLDGLRRHLETIFAQSTSLYNALIRCTNHPIFQQTGLSWTDDDITPIIFDSHEDAFACAIYALVQVYCDRQPLWHLLRAETGTLSLPLTRWAKVILGISKGCDPLRYLYEETYNMNMCWILGLLCMRWPNSDILNYLTQHVLPYLKSTRPVPEDTAGALLLFELVMGMLEAENARCRKVFSIHLVHESSPKENGFFLVNQSLHFAIHGYTDDRSFFNDYISAIP